MKRTVMILCAGVLMASPVFAEKKTTVHKNEEGAKAMTFEAQTDEGPLKRMEANIVEVVATIEALNVDSREISLKGPNGKTVSFAVSPQVKRLNEMKVGDRVRTRYYESIAFEVRPPTERELKNPRQGAEAAIKNSFELPPGVEVDQVTHTLVTIDAIDLEKNTATIKLPEGKLVSIKAKVPENLKRVKVGDTVAVSYARGVAIAIEPAVG